MPPAIGSRGSGRAGEQGAKTTTATGRRDVEAIEKIPNQQAKTIR